MHQYALTLEPVRARRRDPDTSKVAAGRVREFAANHYNKIADALRQGPGTYTEIAERCGLECHAVARRLPEMAHLGVVPTNEKRDGKRVWRIES